MGEGNRQQQNRNGKQIDYYLEGDWLIFLDTCALIEIAKNKDFFWSRTVPLLDQYGKRVIVPYSCYLELDKHSNGSKGEELAEAAKTAKSTVAMLQNKQIDVFADENDGQFADKVLYRVISGVSVERNVLLITQDNNLAKDMLDLNNRRSIQSKKVEVRRVERNGELGYFYWKNMSDKKGSVGKKQENGGHTYEKSNGDATNKTGPKEERLEKNRDSLKKNTHAKAEQVTNAFRICTAITSIPEDEKMPVSYTPGEGDTVYAKVGTVTETIKLVKKLGQGGEGAVYAIDKQLPYVAKIYIRKVDNVNNVKNERRRYEKIKLLIENGIGCEGICFPVAFLYNMSNEFVGYAMPIAKGKEMQRCMAGKMLVERNFPSWKKIDTVQLCVTILKKIKYLQDRNIIMGDINPSNIMIVSPTEVYFVDTDSYQIEDLPCPVGTVNFTAPEIQGKNYSTFLRTKGNENFAIATLLFMIMLPGKPPYSQQGGEDPGKNIRNMDFSYPLGLDTNKKTPEGPWRFLWSHLPYQLKEYFFKTFKRGEEYSDEKSRLSVDDWLHAFETYLKNLKSGRIRQYDEMSEELFPTRFKKNKNSVYIKCRICNSEQDEEYCKEGICSSCLKKGEIHQCKLCGQEMLYSNYERYVLKKSRREYCQTCLDIEETYSCKRCNKMMVYTNYQKYIQKKRRYDTCYECVEKGRQIKLIGTCVDCGQQFEITNNEYDYLMSKGLSLPRRCKSCRGNKNNTVHTAKAGTSYNYSNPTYGNSYASSNSGSGGKSSGWSGCFITTAVCKYLGKTDDCDELMILRSYRDTWLRTQPDGQTLINDYYACAPDMVQKMVSSEYYESYCEMLWNDYILQCVDLIKSQRYNECKTKYKEMVSRLETLLKEEEQWHMI